MVAFLLDGSAGYPGNAYTYIGLQLFTIFLNIMVGDLSTINLSLCMWVKQYQQTAIQVGLVSLLQPVTSSCGLGFVSF